MNNVMAVRNRLGEFVEKKQVTRYEFAKKVGISQNTVYNLCSDPTQIPAAKVMDKIYKTFPDTEPNDLIAFIPDEIAA